MVATLRDESTALPKEKKWADELSREWESFGDDPNYGHSSTVATMVYIDQFIIF